MKGSRGWEQLPTTGSNGGNGKSKGVGKPVPPPPSAGTTPLPPPPPAVVAPPSSRSNSNAHGATCVAALEAYVSNLTDVDRATHRAAFLEFTVSCIGAKVDATLTNGAVVTGYFNTQTADLTVVLKATTTTATGRRGHDAGPAGSDDPAEAGPVAVTGATQVILPDALVTLGVPAASLRVARGGAAAGHELPTDGAIPRGRDLQHLHGRQLQVRCCTPCGGKRPGGPISSRPTSILLMVSCAGGVGLAGSQHQYLPRNARTHTLIVIIFVVGAVVVVEPRGDQGVGPIRGEQTAVQREEHVRREPVHEETRPVQNDQRTGASLVRGSAK